MGIIETLQAEIQSLKERVTALEHKVYGAKIYRTTPEQRAAARERLKARRQLTRDDIIEMAKRDVTHLQRRMATHIVQTEGNKWFQDYVTKAEFIVNREKRTVVALVRLNNMFDESNKVVSRGIAKCYPDDCFNAHIGKAIALRRALGLEVPEAYLNAPQPTEVRVGDVVETYIHGYPERYVVVKTDKEVDEKDGRCHIESIIANYFPVKTKVIDDTREEV
jgi:hypothetical protein